VKQDPIIGEFVNVHALGTPRVQVDPKVRSCEAISGARISSDAGGRVQNPPAPPHAPDPQLRSANVPVMLGCLLIIGAKIGPQKVFGEATVV